MTLPASAGPPRRRYLRLAVVLLMLVCSTAFSYLLLEVAVRVGLSYLPLKMWGYVPENLLPLAQYSKRGTIPDSYVLIAGDSYAVGSGDWYQTADKSSRPPFSSSHVIHQQLGRDVISVGQSGYGSLLGIVTQPIAFYEYVNSTLFFHLPPPQWLLVYFYEGNDLDNNLSEIRSEISPNVGQDRIYEPAEFRKLIERKVVRHPAPPSLADNLYAGQILLRILRAPALADPGPPSAVPGVINKILVNGQVQPIPDGLQSPALELTPDEVQLALYVLEQSLAYVQEYFSHTRIGVVYIPSPLASYQLASASASIQTYEGRADVYPADLVRQRSDAISSRVREIAARHRFAFIDARPRIWSYSQREIVHGPHDWKHFNRLGYTALAEAVISGLQDDR